MPNPPDRQDWGAAILEEVRAAQAAGRELEPQEFLERFLRHAPHPPGRPLPTAAEIMARVAPFQKDLDRIMLETAASFPGGMANPGFADELRKRVTACVASRREGADGASA